MNDNNSVFSQQSNNDELPDDDLELFKKSINRRMLLNLWMLRAHGEYQIDDEEIAKLEIKLYPNLQKNNGEDNNEISQKDVDELQLKLWLADPQANNDSSFQKAIMFRFKQTIVRMRKEVNHFRPHFHIEYNNQYSASYAVDNFERLAGNIPSKYEKPILKWVAQNQKALKITWDKLQAGEDVRELIISAEGST